MSASPIKVLWLGGRHCQMAANGGWPIHSQSHGPNSRHNSFLKAYDAGPKSCSVHMHKRLSNIPLQRLKLGVDVITQKYTGASHVSQKQWVWKWWSECDLRNTQWDKKWVRLGTINNCDLMNSDKMGVSWWISFTCAVQWVCYRGLVNPCPVFKQILYDN